MNMIGFLSIVKSTIVITFKTFTYIFDNINSLLNVQRIKHFYIGNLLNIG